MAKHSGRSTGTIVPRPIHKGSHRGGCFLFVAMVPIITSMWVIMASMLRG